MVWWCCTFFFRNRSPTNLRRAHMYQKMSLPAVMRLQIDRQDLSLHGAGCVAETSSWLQTPRAPATQRQCHMVMSSAVLRFGTGQ